MLDNDCQPFPIVLCGGVLIFRILLILSTHQIGAFSFIPFVFSRYSIAGRWENSIRRGEGVSVGWYMFDVFPRPHYEDRIETACTGEREALDEIFV